MRILVLDDSIFHPGNITERIQAIMPGAEVIYDTVPEVSADTLNSADIIYGMMRRKEMLECFANLKWLHLPSAGADILINNKAMLPDAIYTKSKGAYGPQISEFILSMIMAWNLELPLYGERKRVHEWNKAHTRRTIYGSSVLILGCGDIGLTTAEKLRALGAERIVGVKRTVNGCPEVLDVMLSTDDMEEVYSAAAEADYIICALPGSPLTKNMLDKRFFDAVKPGAFFVNIGRGNVVDEPELVEALTDGRLAGAGLDVFAQEPLSDESPLWDLPNVLMTPHIAGVSPQSHEQRNTVFLELLREYAETGRITHNSVDFEAGY